MVALPSTTKDIGEQLSQQHAAQKGKSRSALLQISSVLRFLARQGLAIRGDRVEKDSNFSQLLSVKSQEDPNLAEWLKRKVNVYTTLVLIFKMS